MADKKNAGRMKAVSMLLLVFGPALMLIFISTRGCEHRFKVLADYGPVADYSFVDARGKKFTAADFKNDIVLITTLQESCPEHCAVSFWHIDQLVYQNHRYSKNRPQKRVRIISFATDGKGNPLTDVSNISQMLKDKVVGYDPDMWIVASGDVRSVYNIKHNGQSLLQKGDQYFGGEAYQELLLLLDKQNHLRMVLSGKTEGMVRRMNEDIALLQKQYDKKHAKELKHKK